MDDRDRSLLKAVNFLSGRGTISGKSLSRRILDAHDWEKKFLLAKDTYGNAYEGPDWVPHSLWSIYEGAENQTRKIAKTLIYSAGARELWAAIEEAYEDPSNMSACLPLELRGIMEHWANINKATPSDHRTHMLRLKAHAMALAAEIDRMDLLDDLLNGEKFDFMRLYSDAERSSIQENIRIHNLRLRKNAIAEQQASAIGWSAGNVPGSVSLTDWKEYNTPEKPDAPESPINWSPASLEAVATWHLLLGDVHGWPGVFPPMPDLFRRLAQYFEREASRPALSRPNFKNAKRNFVTQRLCIFFRDSRGHASPSIVSRIVCMFFEQGITDNEVSQILKGIPGGNKPLEDPESSTEE